jgi:hypothetical protein
LIGVKSALAKFLLAAVVVIGAVVVPASGAFASKGGNGAPTTQVNFGHDAESYALSGMLGGYWGDPSSTSVHVQFLDDFPGHVGNLPFP